jgi:hypothetical protein
MSENNGLYFIRLLQQAYNSSDRQKAFGAALEEIRSKGNLPEYRDGFENFQFFLKVLDEYAYTKTDIVSDLKAGILEAKVIDILTDTFAGSDKERQTIIDVLKADPRFLSEFQSLKAEIEEFLPRGSSIMIKIEKDGQLFASFAYSPSSERSLVKGITPGSYSIKLSTGLLIWQGKLSEKELIWTKAFPREKVKAAAETKAIGQKTSHSEPLLNGELTLEIFPGLESGAIQLSVRKPEK